MSQSPVAVSRTAHPVVVARGLAAALVLVVAVLGVPWLLLRVGHLPDPSG